MREIRERGITLIALVITIVVLLILAGITIGAITGDNGIINKTGQAKEDAEIANEKEIIDTSTVEAMGRNKRGNLVEDEFQSAIDKHTDGKAQVTDIGEEFEVYFTETNRYYMVDKDGNIGEAQEVVKDENSGDITVGKDGEQLDGSAEHPYEISCIEDLVALSNMTRGTGVIFKNKELVTLTEEDKNNFNEKYIKFTRSLNFKSSLSYTDAKRTDFGDINGNDSDGNSLITEMTTEKGFEPLEEFRGILDGNQKVLSNLYIKREENVALIKNLTIGTVKNLEITGNIICLGNNAGAISAFSGNVDNCINRVNIEATGNNVGGVIGGNLSYSMKISNCKNYGAITGNDIVGGIGAMWGTISNCQNYGEIKGLSHIGGISGVYSTVSNCQNYGKIGNEESSKVGGIIGQTTTSLIKNCENYGSVIGKEKVGGVTGDALNATIINCINLGEIKGTTNQVGGIAGYATNFYYILNCYNLGKIEGQTYVGEIIGVMEYIQTDQGFPGKVINCYGAGEIEAENYKGGIVGAKRGYGTHYIENCYWKKELNLVCGENILSNGILEITNSQEYSEQDMKSEIFLQKLNEYVQNYNSGDKAFSKGESLSTWKLGEDGYPTFE